MKNPVLEKTFQFALGIISYCELLDNNKKYAISRQLIRSGTSIGANVRESQNPHSRKDFIAKLITAMKEADETEYWLLLCKESNNYPSSTQLIQEIEQIKKLLGKIISSSKKNG